MIQFLTYLWQLPQNILGFLLVVILRAKKQRVLNDPAGVVVFRQKIFKDVVVSLGQYVVLHEGSDDVTEKHEVGHSYQSMYYGPFYLIVVGIPSILRNIFARILKKDAAWYYKGWPEKQADQFGGVKR